MPNWCLNYVEMEGTTAQVAALETYLRKHLDNEDNPGLLNYFVPQPTGLTAENWDWWNWRVDNWGTKWEVEAHLMNMERGGNTLVLAFDSAWSPPIPVYEAMHAQGWDVRACYWEPGMGFGGEWDNGADVCMSYNSIAEFTESFPWTDDKLGVSECVTQWENPGNNYGSED